MKITETEVVKTGLFHKYFDFSIFKIKNEEDYLAVRDRSPYFCLHAHSLEEAILKARASIDEYIVMKSHEARND